MRILPWGFLEKTSLKIFLRSNFLPVWELKGQGEDGGRGRTFLPLISLFSICRQTTCNSNTVFPLAFLYLGFFFRQQEIPYSEEKQSRSLFTLFHVLKDANHPLKATFSGHHVFTFKMCFAKVVTSLQKTKTFFYKSIFFHWKALNQV